MKILSTIEEYNDAIKSINPRSDLDFDDGSILLDHGWKTRVEAIAKTRNVKHFLYISNDRFGFHEATMLVGEWKRTEAEYLTTYIKSHKEYEPTYENVKACLSLLLIRCKSKNLSDYPKSIQDKWISLGFYFCRDFFETAKSHVDESDWRDWGPYWKNKYYLLKRKMEREGRKVSDEEEEPDTQRP